MNKKANENHLFKNIVFVCLSCVSSHEPFALGSNNFGYLMLIKTTANGLSCCAL